MANSDEPPHRRSERDPLCDREHKVDEAGIRPGRSRQRAQLLVSDAATKYAILALAHISTLEPGERIRAKHLAREIGLPAAFMVKVLCRLAHLELLDALAGHGGGYRLAGAPDRITVNTVISRMANGAPDGSCVLGMGECSEQRLCPLHDEWVAVRDQFAGSFLSMTIADLGRNLNGKHL